MIGTLVLMLAAMAAGPDRSAAPVIPPATPMALPEETVEVIRPGVRIHWLPLTGVRNVEIELRLGRGSLWLDGSDTPACTLTGSLWTTAAKGWSASKLEQRTSLEDVSLSATVGLRTTFVDLTVPLDNLATGLDLFDTVLHAPTYPASEVRRSIADSVQNWTSAMSSDPASLAWLGDQFAWYPADDVRSARMDLDALRAVRSADLRDRQRRLLTSAPVDLLVVGDVDPAALRARLIALLDGVGADVPPADPLPPRVPGTSAVFGVDVPGADQAILTLRTAAPVRGSSDETAMGAIQFALGGQFLSRLNKNLREEKGWTYGGYSSYNDDVDEASWSFQVEVGEANVGAALREIKAELATMASGGITPDEKAASFMGDVAAWNTTLQSAATAQAALADQVAHAETLTDARARLDRAGVLDIATTAQVAQAWLGSADRTLVIVGDRKAIEGHFEDVYGPATWLDPKAVTQGQINVERAR